MLTKVVSNGVKKLHFLETSRQKKNMETFRAFYLIFLHGHFFSHENFFRFFTGYFFFTGIKTLVLTAQIELKSASSAQVKVLRSAKILISAQF